MRNRLTKLSLLRSLFRYIDHEDVTLSRDIFLRKVIDRIVDDLSSSTAVDRPKEP